jgi:hypothetical protein
MLMIVSRLSIKILDLHLSTLTKYINDLASYLAINILIWTHGGDYQGSNDANISTAMTFCS